MAHEGEENRHQIDRAEQPHAEDEAEDAADGEARIGEQAQLDDGAIGAQRAPSERGCADEGEREQPEHGAGEPAAARRLLETDHQARQRDGDANQRGEVELAQLGEIPALARQQHRPERDRDESGSDIDQEQPSPRQRVGDPATNDGPDRRRENGQYAGDRRGHALLTCREQQEYGGEYGGDQRPAGEALDDPPGDQGR